MYIYIYIYIKIPNFQAGFIGILQTSWTPSDTLCLSILAFNVKLTLLKNGIAKLY